MGYKSEFVLFLGTGKYENETFQLFSMHLCTKKITSSEPAYYLRQHPTTYA